MKLQIYSYLSETLFLTTKTQPFRLSVGGIIDISKDTVYFVSINHIQKVEIHLMSLMLPKKTITIS